MNIEEIRSYALSFPEVSEGFPFDNETLVFKVSGKMFALVSLEAHPLRINLKCDPEKALQLREEYAENVLPGYHMNKQMWNTVVVEGPVSNDLLKSWIDDSYELIVSSLPKYKQAEIRKQK